MLAILLNSCTSLSETIKANKAKFIEIGLEESEPINLNDTGYLNRHALFTSRDKKLEYLDVDDIQTDREASRSQLNIDSIVIFKKDRYLIIFDFSKRNRILTDVNSLRNFERIDDRLYVGKM